MTISLEESIRLLRGIAAIDPEMPLQQAHCLLLIAQAEEGTSLTDLANKAGVQLATASRYIGHLGKLNRKREPGLELVEAFEDPMERRKKIIRLSPKGIAAIRKLTGN